MTNPNNAIGTNGAFGGRTSVNAFNDDLSAWSRGVMSGWACVPDSGMTMALGGDSNIRDVAVAVDDAGNRASINNISQAPVKVTIPGAPASNTRIDSIVAYVDNPPQGSATITDNYESCGIIVVSGTATANPVAPNESAIRTAITADGATGATAYYVVLANVSVASGTTDITAGEIEPGDIAGLVGEGIVKAENIDFTASEVTLTFHAGSSSSPVAGTGTATLIELPGNIGMLLYEGETGYNDSGTGVRELTVTFDAGFSSVLGASVNSFYVGNADAYQCHSQSNPRTIDNYVYKSSTNNQMRRISFIIVGLLS